MFPELAARVEDFIRTVSFDVGDGADRFNALALALFRAQFAAVPPYRRLCEARGVTPDDVAEWTQIPAVPTRAFKEFAFTSLPPAERRVVFHSSGTTARRPSRQFHDAVSLGVYEASLWPWFARHLLPEDAGDAPRRWLMLTPPRARAPHSSLVHMLDTVAVRSERPALWLGRATADGAWELAVEETIAALAEAVADGAPVGLLGTAFSFVHLLEALEESGRTFRLPAGSRVMETGGYKGRSRELPREVLHAGIVRRLGVPDAWVVCEYGMSELGSQAYDRVAGRAGARVLRFPPWARARVVSPETGAAVADGASGLVEVFDLANVRSVAAVRTEDLALRRGAGFELVGRAAAAEPRGCSLMAAETEAVA